MDIPFFLRINMRPHFIAESQVPICSHYNRHGHKNIDCLIKNASSSMRSLLVSKLPNINQQILELQSDPPQAYTTNPKQHEIDDNQFDSKSSALTMEAMLTQLYSHQNWALDNGASTHMSKDKLRSFCLSSDPIKNVKCFCG